MFIEIPKGTSPEKIRALLKKRTNIKTKKNIDSFFGKLPDINDDLVYQKHTRGGWNKSKLPNK